MWIYYEVLTYFSQSSECVLLDSESIVIETPQSEEKLFDILNKVVWRDSINIFQLIVLSQSVNSVQFHAIRTEVQHMSRNVEQMKKIINEQQFHYKDKSVYKYFPQL